MKKDTSKALAARLDEAIERGAGFLASLQQPDGSWRGEYGGPMFLLPMYVAARYITGRPLEEERRAGMRRSLLSYQNQNGSLGLHELDSGCMFTSALGYVALRLLGCPADKDELRRLRGWMLDHGTALGAASWGKFMLAVLGLYEYSGIHPVMPELWLLPPALPMHPGRFWCHCRMVYLPMAWLYGRRAQARPDELLLQLREELYGRPYREIDFSRNRDTLAPCDDRYGSGPLLGLVNRALGAYERAAPVVLRRRALQEILRQIDYEDRATDYVRIGPVNAVLNSLVHHFNRPGGAEEERSFNELELYLVDTPEGIKFNGYNNTALWDTAFAAQALAAAGPDGRGKTLQRAFDYLEGNQVRDDLPERERHYRHASRGGWPFSDLRHGWPISDCTAEGLKASLALEPQVKQPLERERLLDAVRLILGMQNRDGGWATYEKKRGPGWLELLNPSQVFSDIMVDYSYVECTSACLQALARARRLCDGALARRVSRAQVRGEQFLRRAQRADGGFYGSWAVCFSYGTWFGVWGLRAVGAGPRDAAVQRAAAFLLARQNPDGGFGESFRSCTERRWVPAPSTASQTAWALLALLRAGLGDHAAARRAAAFLISRQKPDGDWPEEPLVGVFNKTALIDYENYRRTFATWALAEFRRCVFSAPAAGS